MPRVLKLNNQQTIVGFNVESVLEELRAIIGDEICDYLLEEYETLENTVEDLNAEIVDLQELLENYENE